MASVGVRVVPKVRLVHEVEEWVSKNSFKIEWALHLSIEAIILFIEHRQQVASRDDVTELIYSKIAKIRFCVAMLVC